MRVSCPPFVIQTAASIQLKINENAQTWTATETTYTRGTTKNERERDYLITSILILLFTLNYIRITIYLAWTKSCTKTIKCNFLHIINVNYAVYYSQHVIYVCVCMPKIVCMGMYFITCAFLTANNAFLAYLNLT